MYPRQDDRTELYGYWGRGGWAIRPQFKYANSFVNGYAVVDVSDGRQCLIGKDGRLIPLGQLCGGRVPIEDGDHSFSGFGGYESQLPRYAAVRTAKGRQHEWGLIDSSLTYRPLPGSVFAASTYVRTCTDDVVLFRESDRRGDSLCGLFNLNDMRLELPVIYSCIYPSSESIWVVSRPTAEHPESERYAFYDVSKREFLPGWFCLALPFSCGFGAVRVGDWTVSGRSYFVDENLQPAFDAEFDSVGEFSHGLAAVEKDEDVGYIDTTGRMRLVLPYTVLQPFNEFGLAIANRDESEWDIDIIDRKGHPQGQRA